MLCHGIFPLGSPLLIYCIYPTAAARGAAQVQLAAALQQYHRSRGTAGPDPSTRCSHGVNTKQTLPHMLGEAAAVLLDAAGLLRVLRLVLAAQLVRLAVAVQHDAAVACTMRRDVFCWRHVCCLIDGQRP